MVYSIAKKENSEISLWRCRASQNNKSILSTQLDINLVFPWCVALLQVLLITDLGGFGLPHQNILTTKHSNMSLLWKWTGIDASTQEWIREVLGVDDNHHMN